MVTVVPSDIQHPSGSSSSIASSLSPIPSIASLAGITLGTNDQGVEEAIAVLRSRLFAREFIVEHGILQKLVPQQRSATTNTTDGTDDYEAMLAKACRRFDNRAMTVIHDKKSSLINVQIEWHDRKEAADWANALVDKLNEEMRQRALHAAIASRNFLNTEIGKTSDVGTRDAIYRLMEQKVGDEMMADVTKEYAFRIVDRALPPAVTETADPQPWMVAIVGPLLGILLSLFVILWLSDKVHLPPDIENT